MVQAVAQHEYVELWNTALLILNTVCTTVEQIVILLSASTVVQHPEFGILGAKKHIQQTNHGSTTDRTPPTRVKFAEVCPAVYAFSLLCRHHFLSGSAKKTPRSTHGVVYDMYARSVNWRNTYSPSSKAHDRKERAKTTSRTHRTSRSCKGPRHSHHANP